MDTVFYFPWVIRRSCLLLKQLFLEGLSEVSRRAHQCNVLRLDQKAFSFLTWHNTGVACNALINRSDSNMSPFLLRVLLDTPGPGVAKDNTALFWRKPLYWRSELGSNTVHRCGFKQVSISESLSLVAGLSSPASSSSPCRVTVLIRVSGYFYIFFALACLFLVLGAAPLVAFVRLSLGIVRCSCGCSLQLA